MIAHIPIDFYYLAPMLTVGASIVILLLLFLGRRMTAPMCALYAVCVLIIALLFACLLGVQIHRGELEQINKPQKHLLLMAPDKRGINALLAKESANSAAEEQRIQIRPTVSQTEASKQKLKEKQEGTVKEIKNDRRYEHVVQATYVTALFTIDAYALLYIVLILIISVIVISFAFSWFGINNDGQGLFYLLLLFSVLGAIILVYSSHLISLFIGIELLSTPLIGLIGFQYTQKNAIEASIKYMVLSAITTAFLLLGIAFYYAATGELTFSGLSFQLSTEPKPNLLLLTGVCLLLIGIGFKLSLVPFQLWLPDVFQGAPTSISLFLSTVGKLAVFCAVARLFLVAPIVNNESIQLIVVIMAFGSIVFGSFFALMQQNVKRLLACASIANYGYLFVALIGVQYQVLAIETIGIYLISYILSNICVFGAINLESSAIQNRDKEMVSDLKGLFWRKPITAAIMTMGLLSLAGIPLTLGFIGRFLLLLLSVTAQLWWLIAAIVVGSVFGIYFYFRLIINLYLRDPKNQMSGEIEDRHCRQFQLRVLTLNEICLLVSSALLIFCGAYPQWLLSLVSSAHYLAP